MATTASSIESVRDLLADQPWFPLHMYRGDIAEIRFDTEHEEDARALAEELAEQGFEVEVLHPIALSSIAHTLVMVTVNAGATWVVQEVLKGIIPPTWRWTLDPLLSVKRGGVHIHQALLFQERVRPCLTRGSGKERGATTPPVSNAASSAATRCSGSSKNGPA